MKNTLKIVLVIIGSLIGAGFASGKEIYTFFYIYGYNGGIGILISSCILGMVIYKTLNIILKNNILNYKDFLNYIIKNNHQNTKYIKNIINNIMNILILVTFFIMIAGFGAYFKQEFNMSSIIGSSILAICCYFILIEDTRGLIKTNEILVPLIIISIIIIGFFKIDSQCLNINKVEKSGFCINSILYCSYNSIMLIPVLITIKKYISSKRVIRDVSVITTIMVVSLSLIVFVCLNSITGDLSKIDIPIIYILKNNCILKNWYGIVILISIFTTAVSLGNSFIKNISKKNKSYTHIVSIMCITSVFISQIGFSNLVNLLYPLFGCIGIVQIINLILVK